MSTEIRLDQLDVLAIGWLCVCVVVWLLLESVEQGHIVPGVALAVCADTALSSTASWASHTNDLIHPRPLTPLHPMA